MDFCRDKKIVETPAVASDQSPVMQAGRNLVLVGFMGTGKTTVGALVAERLGWAFVDTDLLVEAEAGMPVREIFARQGEDAFRVLETHACRVAGAGTHTVISVGGGALVNPENRRALEANGVPVLLTCERDRLVERLEESARRGERPLLSGDIGAKIDSLAASRAGVYSTIALKVDTTHLTPEEVAEKVIAIVEEDGGRRATDHGEPETGDGGRQIGRPSPVARRPGPIPVRTPGGEYSIMLGSGVMAELGERARGLGLGMRVVIASDTNVAPLYAERVVGVLEGSGFRASMAVMPAGEQHKSWESVEMFVEAFLDAGLDRGGWVAALGGGVVGDTAGFAASIYMRGVGFVQLPTTLLAMADSSIGGKVGVDHPRGKNLLGAFKQPALVVADLDMLASLPAEQIACGMAEVIKAGVIADPVLFELLEATDGRQTTYDQRLTIHDSLRRAIEVKRGTVERDPHEAGERALLNLGHTFGHAFEKCTGYNRPHGYAVAQGMVVAFRLAEALGMCDEASGERVERVLSKYGLPTRWGDPDLGGEDAVERVLGAMMLDKKRVDGRLRLVLPEAIGRVRLVDDAPEAAIKKALAETI
jgi:shikimate kinase/3-dehydroquinate synthase